MSAYLKLPVIMEFTPSILLCDLIVLEKWHISEAVASIVLSATFKDLLQFSPYAACLQ